MTCARWTRALSTVAHPIGKHTLVAQVPEDMKVAIVSVVGAFRTGKSFLLDIFLRYLLWRESHEGTNMECDVD